MSQNTSIDYAPSPKRSTNYKQHFHNLVVPAHYSPAIDTSERTAHISTAPQADVTPMPEDPSEDAVRLRAYFISERRRRFALPGDTESDWLEAKRQLLAEARR